MNQEQFKAVLQRDKLFLKDLYTSNSVSKCKQLLNFASDLELNTLVKYIHFISNGHIKIKKQNFDALTKRHLNVIKKHLEKKSQTQTLVQAPRKVKLQLLFKLCTALSNLLTPLFKE